MSEPTRNPSRRGLLLLGGLLAFGIGANRLIKRGARGDFEFEDLPGLDGWRRLRGEGQSSASAAVFAGLDPAAPRNVLPRRELCSVLFPDPPEQGVVRIASFSDYFCPYCRVLTERLAARAAEPENRVKVTWHELPLVAPASEIAARAALAARAQGGYLAYHKRLMRAAFQPTPAYLQEIGDSAGLDGAKLIQDMNSPKILSEIDQTIAAAALLGIPGTPALVVGSTLVIGQISEPRLAALIEIERDRPQAC